MREIARAKQGFFPTQGRIVRAISKLFKLTAGPIVVRKAVGVLEAKRVCETLSDVADQSGNYGASLPEFLRPSRGTLPFYYESTGVETNFRDECDPQPRSRRVSSFHRPETLAPCNDLF